VIAHTFECRTVWLGKDRRHLCRIQIAGFRYRCPLDRDVVDLSAWLTGKVDDD